jgi:heterotetrameric sarcosine oxidase gamma subunit
MFVSAPEPLSPFGPTGAPGRHGVASAAPVTLTPRRVDIVQVTGADEAAARVVRSAAGLALPPPRRAEIAGDALAVWVQPSSWLVIRPRGEEGALARMLAAGAGDGVAIVDQSHGKALLRLAGPRARDVLAKGCRVDLHPRAFASGSAATTTVDHVTINLVQVDAAPTYDIVVPATFAENFLEWLIASAAEFGCEVRPPA